MWFLKLFRVLFYLKKKIKTDTHKNLKSKKPPVFCNLVFQDFYFSAWKFCPGTTGGRYSPTFRRWDTVAAWWQKRRHAMETAAGHASQTAHVLGNRSAPTLCSQGIQGTLDALFVDYKWYTPKYLSTNPKKKQSNPASEDIQLLVKQLSALFSLLSVSSLKYSFKQRDPASDFMSLW